MDKRRVKNMLLRLLILSFFVGFGALVVMSSGFSEVEPTQSVRISIDHSSGQSFIREEDVERLIGKHFSDFTKVDASSLRRLEKYLEANPYIRKANAFVDSKGNLQVGILQRSPMARVMPKEGRQFYIDEEGYKFPLSKIHTSKAPLITGWLEEEFSRVDTVKSDLLRQAFSVIRFAAADSFWSAQVAQVHVNEQKELLILPRMGEHVIMLGDSKDLANKFRNLGLFYEHVLNQQGWDKYKTINLQYKNQIVCK